MRCGYELKIWKNNLNKLLLRLNKEENSMEVCKVPNCKKECKSAMGLMNHITKTHRMKVAEYEERYGSIKKV